MGNNIRENGNDLFSFAVCGKDEEFNNKLKFLAENIVEKENWDLEEKNDIRILRRHILLTFARCKEQSKILYSNDNEYCATNTSLLSEYGGKDVMMVFKKNAYRDCFDKNPYQKEWYLWAFKTSADRDYMDIFKGKVPEMATYTDNVEDFFFNPNINIEVDIEHIVEDNWERINKNIALPKEVVQYMIPGVIDVAIKKAKRNYRLVIPEYHHDKIGYIMPIIFPIGDDKYTTMALIIEKLENIYRANTIFDVKSAYSKARILMKPETNWLLEKR